MYTFTHKKRLLQGKNLATSSWPSRRYSGQNHELASTLQLQRMDANQAGQREVQANTGKSATPSAATTSLPLFLRNSSHTSTYPTAQPKLAINPPGDRHEQEADRVADQVMQKPGPAVQHLPENEINELPQSKASPGQTPHVSNAMAEQIQELRGGGHALDPSSRAYMESRFGRDFNQVRVHRDNRAANLAQSMNAKAFTIGHDVVFGSGEYSPNSHSGRKLIAHELTHVNQQNNMTRTRETGKPSPFSTLIQRQPKQDEEKESPTPKEKTLKAAGISVSDPTFNKTAQIIDEVIQRNKKLAPYISKRLKSGFKIEEKGKFIFELSDSNFNASYIKVNGKPAPRLVMGFYDPVNFKIHLRPDAIFGTALHESVHKLAAPVFYTWLGNFKISDQLMGVLKEGITSYFTDSILADEGLSANIDAYSKHKENVDKLVKTLGPNGFDTIARLYFQADINALLEIGRKLGLKEEQSGDINAHFKLLESFLTEGSSSKMTLEVGGSFGRGISPTESEWFASIYGDLTLQTPRLSSLTQLFDLVSRY